MLEEAFAGIPNVRIGSGEGKIIHIPNKKINESYKQKKKFIETK